MTVEQEYAPGGLVPPAPTRGWLTRPVVFVPLGYGPAVAARAARLALLARTGWPTEPPTGPTDPLASPRPR
ncbi:hypothetical protein [Streptomyces sp. AD55]|uniref:hypothetical protein n=1 Tax=Streptomyces sp. AD55 TaxID=3242895 RepID=UPI003529CE2E